MATQPAITEADLMQFTGTDNHYKTILPKIVYTDGVQYLAEKAGAYWLIDLVASWQLHKKVRSETFQVWTLTVTGSKAVAKADDGNGNVVAKQVIEYTDFPLAEVKLYCVDGCIMLPSEY